MFCVDYPLEIESQMSPSHVKPARMTDGASGKSAGWIYDAALSCVICLHVLLCGVRFRASINVYFCKVMSESVNQLGFKCE